MSSKITIIIPVYNAEQTIEALVKKLVFEISKNNALEVILVNDCSSDQSEEKCIDLFKTFPDTVILDL